MFRKVQLAAAVWSGLFILAMVSTASAQSNEFRLDRFGHCGNIENNLCKGGVDIHAAHPQTGFVASQGFRSFSRQLGLATADYAFQPAETTGQNGFALQVNMTSTAISQKEEFWRLADYEMRPSSSISMANLSIRKGLPFSLEAGFNVGVVLGTDLATVGGELKYALNEDWLWPFPDIAVRVWGNTLLGSRNLDLYNVGGDVILSVPFAIKGAVRITPIAGYSLHAIISRTGVLNAMPGNPMPSIVDENGRTVHGPEFVLGVENQIVHRMFVGFQVSVAALDLNFQASFLDDHATIGGGFGVSF